MKVVEKKADVVKPDLGVNQAGEASLAALYRSVQVVPTGHTCCESPNQSISNPKAIVFSFMIPHVELLKRPNE